MVSRGQMLGMLSIMVFLASLLSIFCRDEDSLQAPGDNAHWISRSMHSGKGQLREFMVSTNNAKDRALRGSLGEDLGNNFGEHFVNLTGRIINGQDVETLERYPYFVSLLNSEYHHVCGGSLIAPDTVLTAAHCDGNLRYAIIGLYDRSKRQAHEVIPIKSTHPHELFGHAGLSFDQMVVVLRRPSKRVTPVKVNLNAGVPLLHDTIVVVGLGVIDAEKSTLPGKLQWMEGTHITNDACNEILAGRIERDMMCMGGVIDENSQESRMCNGDSGGPWVLPGSHPQEDVQIATVSWGVRGCKPGFPNVASRTSATNLITRITCSESASPPSYFECHPAPSSISQLTQTPTMIPTKYSLTSPSAIPSDFPSAVPSTVPHNALNDFHVSMSNIPSDSPSFSPSLKTSFPSAAPDVVVSGFPSKQ